MLELQTCTRIAGASAIPVGAEGAGRQPLRPALRTIFLAGLMALSAPLALGETTFRGHVSNGTHTNANDFHIFLSPGSPGAHDPHAPPFTTVDTKQNDNGETEITFTGASVPAGTTITFDFYNSSRKAPDIARVTWTSNSTTIGTIDGSRISLTASNWPTQLKIGLRTDGASLSWPTNIEEGFVLKATTSLTSPHWSLVPQPPAIVGDQFVVTDPVAPGMKFYRLVNTTPPAFLSVAPDSNSDGLTLTFSEPLDPLSATNLSNYYLADSQFVAIFPMGAILSSPESVDLLINPPLAPGESYYLAIEGVANLAGYVMLPVTLTFTNPVPNTTPPTLVSVVPDAADRLTLTFSEPVDELSATDLLNYYLADSQFTQTFSLQALLTAPDSVDLIINPPMVSRASYDLWIGGVQDLAGNVMSPVTVTFSMP